MLLAILAIAGNAVAQGNDAVPVPGGTTIVQTDTSGDTPSQPPVTTPETPAQPVPVVVTTAPDLQLRALLLKQVKLQAGRYSQLIVGRQRLMGLRLTPISLSRLTSLDAANSVLARVKTQSNRLYMAARRWMRQRISEDLRNIGHWRLVMGLRPIVRTLATRGNLEERYHRISTTAHQLYRQYTHPPHLNQFLCIHHYEGSWTDSGAPFWGGVQMNYGFQATYGPWLLKHKGTADHWTPLEQIWTAEKAERTRGFWPWPNTARICGLL